MSNNAYKYLGKYIIKADLKCITGLHIGGTDEGFDIGGIDNPVIKDPITGYPYIPGSSLKGKIRSLLEWIDNKVVFKQDENKIWSGKLCNCGNCDICIIFGASADVKGQKEPTRLTVRDSYPKGLNGKDGQILPEDKRTDTIADWKTNLGVKIFTEAKTENAIDRLTSAANPRSMERVPADSVFEVEIVYDLYNTEDMKRLKKVFEGMLILEDSSLGGGGSRGSGKVRFENFQITKRNVGFYTKGEAETTVSLNGKMTAKQIFDGFTELFK